MALVLPFNFKPSNITFRSGDNINFTVPSGEYCFVTVSMEASVSYCGYQHDGTAVSGGAGMSDSKTVEHHFWLQDGDVLDSSVPSETTGGTVSSTESTTITVTCDVGGQVIQCVAKAGVSINGTGQFTKNTVARFNATITRYTIP